MNHKDNRERQLILYFCFKLQNIFITSKKFYLFGKNSIYLNKHSFSPSQFVLMANKERMIS